MLGPHIINFMKATLGEDGTSALAKAAERSESLATALPPRTILSWLQFSARFGYEGEIPGIPNSYIQFTKTSPDGFSGYVEMDGPTGPEGYEFENASILHLAAATAVAMGVDAPVDPGLRNLDLAKLGKNIDVLIGTRFLNLAKKALEESSSNSEESTIEKDQDAPGQAAGPRPPKAPTMAVPQVKQPRVSAKPPKTAQLKITKAQGEHECQVCGEAQFKGDEFQGCFCVRDLAKHTVTHQEPDGDSYIVEFGPEWTENDISVLIDMIED